MPAKKKKLSALQLKYAAKAKKSRTKAKDVPGTGTARKAASAIEKRKKAMKKYR